MPLTLTIGQAILFALICTRVTAMMLIAPVFGSQAVPLRFRLLIALAVSTLVAPVFMNGHLEENLTLVTILSLFMGEMAVGLVFGLSLTLLFAAVQLAGQQFAGFCGTQFPGLTDSISSSPSPPIAQLYSLICLLIFLGIGGHRRTMSGLLDSFYQSPPGTDHMSIDFLPLLTEMLARSFEFGVRLGAPIVLSALLALLLLGVVSRGLPHFNLMNSSFTINSLLTLVMMIVAVGSAEILIDAYHEQMNQWINEVLESGHRSVSVSLARASGTLTLR